MDIFKLDADVYRMAVGITELGCVVAILFLDRRVRVLATYILLLFMVGISQYVIIHHSTPN